MTTPRISMARALGILMAFGARMASGDVQPPPPPEPVLRVESARLSAHLDATPLRRVVELLAQETGAVVTGVDEDDPGTVAASFGPLPLLEGLRRLLEPRSFTVRTSGSGPSERLIGLAVLGGRTTAQVVARGAMRAERDLDDEPGAPRRPRDAQQIEADLIGAPDPAARIDAIDALTHVTRPRERRQVLSRALLDDADATVRRAAFEGLETSNGFDAELAASFVRVEPDAELRHLALPVLEAHAAHDDAAWAALAWLAGNDSDPGVRAIAGDLIARGRGAADEG